MTRTEPAPAHRIALLALALALTVAGCGTTTENRGLVTGTPTPRCGGPTGRYLIGVSQANVAEPYRQRMDDDIRAAARSVPQFELRFADAAQDNARQVADVENFLVQQVDLLVISPNESTPLTAVVRKAYAKGIPVLVLDRQVDGEAYTAWIGGDNTQIGYQAGRHVAERLLPGGGTVVELTGLAGSTPARERDTGFRRAIAGRGDIRILTQAAGDWLREKAQEQMDAILKAQPRIDVVYAENDPMAEGAYLAARAAGRERQIAFVGIDALPIPSGGIRAVAEGRLAATLTYPTGGREAVTAARRLLVDCQPVPKRQTLPTRLITRANAEAVYRAENPGG